MWELTEEVVFWNVDVGGLEKELLEITKVKIQADKLTAVGNPRH